MPRLYLEAACLWLFSLFLFCNARAQTTPISGIVNSYHSIIEVLPAEACVRVSNTSGLGQADKIMIIQMKGASLNTANPNSSSWGDTTALNNAGNYEINYICSVRGDSVFLVYNLLNTYTAPTGKVQLVTIPAWQNADVIDTIKAKPWDNTSGTGGVIAFDVIETLTLNAPIYADSSGYRGGAFFQHNGTCNFFSPVGTGYAYDATGGTNQNGAYKGEGVGDVAANVDGGKGPPANGGGGGNNHNNSGGGGANLFTGGRGGGNSSSGPSGCNTANNMGLGGRALSSWNGKKIFPGGGGGAGHNNNAVFTIGGGNGGGIIFIHAATLTGNGYKISAGGGAGGQSQGDGAGGGGGGGTIILDINTYSGSAIIQANGGNGGNSNDVMTPGRCFGGGGGGSGGMIYFTGATPAVTTTANGGTGGIETQREATCAAPVPGLAGNNGQLIPNYVYRQATVFASDCGIILPVRLISFSATLQGEKVKLNWRIAHPEQVSAFTIERQDKNGRWIGIYTISGVDTTDHYIATDIHPLPGENLYRLNIREKDNSVSFSPTRRIVLGSRNDFIVYPNPSSGKITLLGHFTQPVLLQLLNLSGKLLMQKKISPDSPETELPVLPKGVYVLRIDDVTQKLVIR